MCSVMQCLVCRLFLSSMVLRHQRRQQQQRRVVKMRMKYIHWQNRRLTQPVMPNWTQILSSRFALLSVLWEIYSTFSVKKYYDQKRNHYLNYKILLKDFLKKRNLLSIKRYIVALCGGHYIESMFNSVWLKLVTASHSMWSSLLMTRIPYRSGIGNR